MTGLSIGGAEMRQAYDRAEIEELHEPECFRLLSTVAVGRVALTRHALPVILPVNFTVDGQTIVLRTGPGSVLAAARDGVVVAFEADELDPRLEAGWSVLVTGTMREITGASELLRVNRLHLFPWAGGDRPFYVRITPGIVSGRRVGSWRR
jgi:nitroimidazol reductase NimA-like FMN-containing flavoprotein (pyridoxamine 5'-phosphate oxidase superfamily)